MINLVHLSFRSRNFEERFRWCHRPLDQERPGVCRGLFSGISARMKTQSDDTDGGYRLVGESLRFPS